MDSTSFTFLATILILVLLSASLVLRSYILRRRYRLHFQQALTNGVFADIDHDAFNATGQFDTFVGFRRVTRRPGPKPVIWDVWIDKHPTWSWSSITPVAVRCAPSISPSTLISSSTGPSGSPSLHQSQSQPRSRSSFFSTLRLPSVFSLSPRSSSSLSEPRESPPSGSRSSPQSSSPGTSANEKSAATLSICVLVAMPDKSAPVYRPLPDTKGKGVQSQPLESQQRDDANPLLPSAPQSRSRSPHFIAEEELPILEFGAVEVGAGEWAWTTCEL